MKAIIKSALKWALIGGLGSIVLQTILLLISPTTIGGSWVLLSYMPLLFCMIFGGITIRKESGGDIGFKNAFIAVFIIAAIGSLLFNIYVYEIWMKIIDPGFMEKVLNITERQIRDQQDKYSWTDEQAEERIKFMRELNFEKWAYIISSVCTILLSLLVSVFVTRPDKENQSLIKSEA